MANDVKHLPPGCRFSPPFSFLPSLYLAIPTRLRARARITSEAALHPALALNSGSLLLDITFPQRFNIRYDGSGYKMVRCICSHIRPDLFVLQVRG